MFLFFKNVVLIEPVPVHVCSHMEVLDKQHIKIQVIFLQTILIWHSVTRWVFHYLGLGFLFPNPFWRTKIGLMTQNIFLPFKLIGAQMRSKQREKHDSTFRGPGNSLRKSAHSQTSPHLFRCPIILLVFFVFQSQAIVPKANNASYVTQAVTGGTSPPCYQCFVFILFLESNSLNWAVSHAVAMAGRWEQPQLFTLSRDETKKEMLVCGQKTQIGSKEKDSWERENVRGRLLWWE